ncbi:hypothetical protein B9Z55_012472 [Caenorhabditis nigoni]|uniref:Uncharacterized protein n=2 Tax=Caenorhabditis nigoni TaxID=1611254 RepID=A0A2G5TXB1_9PELO|nr:hypothetical protein B9Z55_012472 [Caenorhabditis nigoni]
MSVSKSFVLDDDGRCEDFSSKVLLTNSASENDFLKQKLGNMSKKFNFENSNAVQQTIQNLQKFTKLSRNGAHNLLSPLISLINEKDNDSFKQVANYEDIVERIHVAWQEDQSGRVLVKASVMKICEWMLDKGFSSVDELEENWKVARQARMEMGSLLESNTVQLKCARKRAHDQTVECQQLQKECDELRMENRKLCEQLDVARSDTRKMTVHQESEHKLFVSENKRISVGSSEYNADSFEHMEKEKSSQVELEISVSGVAKMVPSGEKREEEFGDLNIENGFLSNGQCDIDTMVLREGSTDDKADESVCMDIKEESAEGNVEDSRVVLCSGDQKSDEFQRFCTTSTHDDIKDFKEVGLVTEAKQSNETCMRGEINQGSSNVKVYQSQENVQNKEIGFQNVIEKFDILENPRRDPKKQSYERSTVSTIIFEDQRTVSEIIVETDSESSKEKEESNVQDKKANDFRKSQGPPMRLLSKSSNLDLYENVEWVLWGRDKPNKDVPIFTSGKSPPLEKRDPKKAGEGACGFGFQTETSRRIQEELWPPKDPPQLCQANDSRDSQVNSDQVQTLLHQEFRPRKDPPQQQMSQSKDTSHFQDQVKTCLHHEFRPRKDPPRMHPDNTRGYEFQPEPFEVHLHHEFRPRKDPPCREHHHHNISSNHYGSITDSWSNFVIDVH